MKQFMIYQIVLGCALFFTQVVNQARANTNLITNGSFELGIPWRDNVPLGSTGITGWTVTRAQIDLVGPYWQASDGNRSLDLNGSPGVGGILQTIATIPGRVYEVQFDQAANPDLGPRVSLLGVESAGQSAQFAFDCTGCSLSIMGWTQKEWQFVAMETETTLEFYSLDAADSWKGPALDNVTVIEIPEPITLYLLGLGGLVLRRRRRVK